MLKMSNPTAKQQTGTCEAVEEVEQVKKLSESTVRSMFLKFCERTSIPGVPHVRQSKSSLRKLGWTAFIIFGLGMAIYQSKDLIIEYRKHAVFMVITEKEIFPLQYPAITFCPQMPILWETVKQMNHSVYNNIMDKKIKRKLFSENNTFQTVISVNSTIVRWAVFNLTEEERNKILLHHHQYFITYSFNNFESTEYLYGVEEMYIPHYGKCFTFDPIKERKSNEQNLQFLIYLNKKEIPPNKHWEAESKIFIHAPNTGPPLLSNNFAKVKPQQHLRATVSLKEFNRLPDPYPSGCFDSENIDWRSLDPWLANETHLYTKEQCRMMLVQHHEKEKCNSINLPIRRKEPSLCGFFNDYKFQKLYVGLCAFPCHEFQYDWKILVTPMESIMLEEILMFVYNRQNPLNGRIITYFPIPNVTFEEFKQGISLIELYPESSVYTSYSEKPKFTLGDLLGAIGGNLGLWIGISLISFIEVFDFVINLIGRYLKLLWKKIWKKH